MRQVVKNQLEKKVKYQELTSKIIGCIYEVHNTLGEGFLESVYCNALAIELQTAGLKLHKEFPIKVFYKDKIVGDYQADLVVEGKVILELKAVKELHPAHEAQLIHYLRATGIEIGLLVNFGRSAQVKRKICSKRHFQKKKLNCPVQ